MTAAEISRWSRRFVLAGCVFLVMWQLSRFLAVPRQVEVYLGLYGFVFHVIFAKAYSLIPTYFNRELAFTRAPAVQFPLTVAGVIGLVAGSLSTATVLGQVGAVGWLLGVLVFAGVILLSISDNILGAETATSSVNEQRVRIDRFSNFFVPFALGYLLLGAIETAGYYFGGFTLIGAYHPRVTHVLGAGTASLLIFTIGFRLLPRFFAAHPPEWLVAVVLPAGAIGPVLLAISLPAGDLMVIGGLLLSVAIIGYLSVIVILFHRSDRSRVGFYGVGFGALFGASGAGFGVWLVILGVHPTLVAAHYQLMLLGFLGLTIIGVSFQFYPPAVSTWPGVSDRSAIIAIVLIASGVIAHVVGTLLGQPAFVMPVSALLSAAGALLYAVIIAALFRERFNHI